MDKTMSQPRFGTPEGSQDVSATTSAGRGCAFDDAYEKLYSETLSLEERFGDLTGRMLLDQIFSIYAASASTRNNLCRVAQR